MLSLSLFSSSKSVSIAVSDREKVIQFFHNNDEAINKSNLILLLIKGVLQNYKITDFENIIFSRGPGGFTSIRSMISISQGLSLGNKIKILTVDTFEIFLSEIEPKSGLTVVFFQESRNDFYFKLFSSDKDKWKEESKIFSGFEKDIEEKIFDFSKTNKPKKINLISNFPNNPLKEIPNAIFTKRNINAKSITKCFFKKYTKCIIKPIYHHPHYGKKN